MSESTAIVVFAFNEAESIGTMLGELRAALDDDGRPTEIVVVDDGSTDGTLERARATLAGARATFVRHESNRGIGAALKSGVRATTADFVTFLPADGQIPPTAIGTLRDVQALDDADLVLSVYDHRDDGAGRAVLSWGVRALITVVHGVELESDGPYLFRRRLFDPDQLPSDSFFLNFEFPILASAAGLTVRTVTIPCRPRRAGVSKSTGLQRIVGVAKDLVGLRARRIRGAIARLR